MHPCGDVVSRLGGRVHARTQPPGEARPSQHRPPAGWWRGRGRTSVVRDAPGPGRLGRSMGRSAAIGAGLADQPASSSLPRTPVRPCPRCAASGHQTRQPAGFAGWRGPPGRLRPVHFDERARRRHSSAHCGVEWLHRPRTADRGRGLGRGRRARDRGGAVPVAGGCMAPTAAATAHPADRHRRKLRARALDAGRQSPPAGRLPQAMPRYPPAAKETPRRPGCHCIEMRRAGAGRPLCQRRRPDRRSGALAGTASRGGAWRRARVCPRTLLPEKRTRHAVRRQRDALAGRSGGRIRVVPLARPAGSPRHAAGFHHVRADPRRGHALRPGRSAPIVAPTAREDRSAPACAAATVEPGDPGTCADLPGAQLCRAGRLRTRAFAGFPGQPAADRQPCAPVRDTGHPSHPAQSPGAPCRSARCRHPKPPPVDIRPSHRGYHHAQSADGAGACPLGTVGARCRIRCLGVRSERGSRSAVTTGTRYAGRTVYPACPVAPAADGSCRGRPRARCRDYAGP